MNNVQYICVPIQCGCDRPGGELAPSALCAMLSQDRAIDTTELTIPMMVDEHKYMDSPDVKYLSVVVNTCMELREYVYQALQHAKCVCTLGGDHSLALGSISGVLQQEPNTGVIWFDAHTDINTEASSPSGNAHGMPVAALMGLCASALNEVATVRLHPQNIYWVGARDIDPGEWEILRRLGIEDHVYSSDDVHRRGMNVVMDEIAARMAEQGITALHLSFDVDGMDPSIVAATGTKVPNGLTQADLDTFIAHLSSLPPMRSMDFVEYNPLMDDEAKTTGKWCEETLMRVVGLKNKA